MSGEGGNILVNEKRGDILMDNNKHIMTLAEVRNGIQCWQCQHCPRRILLSWVPFKRTVLVAGDKQALHSGSSGELQIGRVIVDDLPPIGGLGDVIW